VRFRDHGRRSSICLDRNSDCPSARVRGAPQSIDKDLHRSTQKITELVPGKKVVWHVTDAKLNFVKNKTEWNGTGVVFAITKQGGKAELRFTPVGLVPALEWYSDCSSAWGFYINDSLQSLVTKGKGQPARKEKVLGEKGQVFPLCFVEMPPVHPSTLIEAA
jgi:hypothetical protein